MKKSLFKKILVASLIFLIIYQLYLLIKPGLCFHNHLADAIALNKARKNYYSEKSNGASAAVSEKLIGQESASLIPAIMIDLKAFWYRSNGVNLICDEFVSMNDVKKMTAAPKYSGQTTDEQFNALANLIQMTKQIALTDIRQNQFGHAAAALNNSLELIAKMESSSNGSFCMTRHILESSALAAEHAQLYHEKSSGQTDAVMKEFISSQLQVADSLGPELDRAAQKIHRLNVGIICNDVPPIL